MVEIKQRFDEIDILKSFGIILMIMGHIGFGSVFDYWIHAFHMPMFYLISGFLYKKSTLSFNKFVKKKAKSLLLPYIIFAMFHLVVWYLLLYIFDKNINLQAFISIVTFNTKDMPISGALWFLTSLFFVDIIYFLIDKLNNIICKYLIIAGFSLLGCILPLYLRLPWALDTSFMAIGLYAASSASKKYIIKANKLYIGITLLVLGSILTFFNGYVNVREGHYSNIILYYTVAILITYGLYMISIRLKKYNNKLVNELKFIGKNSLVYVCLNQIILFVPNKVLSLSHNIYFTLLGKIIVLIVSLSILHLIVILLNKRYLKWILGK